MKKKLLFIYNPRAGRGKVGGNLADIIEVFAKADYSVIAAPTLKSGDATTYARERDPDVELVVCSGGDGTLDETVTGVVESGFRTPIGYIPSGSTNDFGESLDISKDMVTAAETIVAGRSFECDLGVFNNDYFVYVAAFGLFTDVSYETKQSVKNLLGHGAYLLEGMKRIPFIRPFPMKVTYGDNVIEDEFAFGMVTNSFSVGGIKNITGKDVEMDDGLFEVTLIKMPKNPFDLNEILRGMLDREFDSEFVYRFSASEITFESPEPTPWTRDGENGGSHTNVSIKNICRGIDIKVDL